MRPNVGLQNAFTAMQQLITAWVILMTYAEQKKLMRARLRATGANAPGRKAEGGWPNMRLEPTTAAQLY